MFYEMRWGAGGIWGDGAELAKKGVPGKKNN